MSASSDKTRIASVMNSELIGLITGGCSCNCKSGVDIGISQMMAAGAGSEPLGALMARSAASSTRYPLGQKKKGFPFFVLQFMHNNLLKYN